MRSASLKKIKKKKKKKLDEQNPNNVCVQRDKGETHMQKHENLLDSSGL